MLTRIVILVSCWFALISAYSQIIEIEEKLKDVNTKIASKAYTEAEKLLNEVLNDDPDNFLAQEIQINLLYLTDREQEALKIIEEKLEKYNDLAENHYLKGVLNMRRNKQGKALIAFETAFTKEMPAEYLDKLYLNYAMGLLYMQEYDKAEENFINAAELSPQNAVIYHGLGMLKYEMRLYDEAAANFNKSLNLDEENPITLYNLGMCYFRLEEGRKACYYFNLGCNLGNKNACKIFFLECSQINN